MLTCKQLSNTNTLPYASSDRFIDLATTSHMTHDRSYFTSFTHINPHKVDLERRAIVTAGDKSDVIMKRAENGKIKNARSKCIDYSRL